MNASVNIDLSALNESERHALRSALDLGYLVVPDGEMSELVDFYMAFRFLCRQPAILVSAEFEGDRLITVTARPRALWEQALRAVSLLDYMDLDIEQEDLTLSLAVHCEHAAGAAKLLWEQCTRASIARSQAVFSLAEEPARDCLDPISKAVVQ